MNADADRNIDKMSRDENTGYRFIDFLSFFLRIANYIGISMIAVLVVLTVADVVFHVPGYDELAEIVLGLFVFLTLANCAIEGGHITVDVVYVLFPKYIQYFVDVVVQLICFSTTTLIAWRLFEHAIKLKGYHEVSTTLGITMYPFVFIACFGFVLLSIVYITTFFDLIFKAKKQ